MQGIDGNGCRRNTTTCLFTMVHWLHSLAMQPLQYLCQTRIQISVTETRFYRGLFTVVHWLHSLAMQPLRYLCQTHNALLSLLMSYPQKFVAQFQSFETCLLGMGGNIYGQAITDIQRLLHIEVQDRHDIHDQDIRHENYFDAEVILLPLGRNRLNAQQHIQLC